MFKSFFSQFPKSKVILTGFLVLNLYACGVSRNNKQNQDDSSDPGSFASSAKYAVVVTQAPDFSSGAHSVVSYNQPRSAINNFLPTISDLAVSSYVSSFYRIERFGANNVTKFRMDLPYEPVWQFSTEGAESDSNPYQIVFLSGTKAYLLRYGSPKLWIINPSVSQDEASEFKTGEIDLSAYSNCDGKPEMASAIIVGSKLFIAIQRLCNWLPNDDAYIAVFDTNTDTEINTGQGTGGLKGVKLDVTNPFAKIKYYDGYIYVAGADGIYWGANNPLKAGIQRININNYTKSAVFLSDMQISSMEVVSHNKVYLIEYADWGDTRLRLLDFETGTLDPNNVAGIGDTGDRNIQSITKDSDGMLWLSDASLNNPGIYVIDTVTDTAQEGPISTDLNPLEVVFCER